MQKTHDTILITREELEQIKKPRELDFWAGFVAGCVAGCFILWQLDLI